MSFQVAIVDDHEAVRLGFAAACDKNDFELVGSAPNVSELLEQIEFGIITLGDVPNEAFYPTDRQGLF